MRLPTGNTFKGMLPRIAPDKLPEDFAVLARDCRLLSGSLEAFREPLVSPDPLVIVKEGEIRSLWLMDPDGDNGGPYALHWTEDVEVARGMNAGDIDERTYFTGVDGGPYITTKPLATDPPPPDGVEVGEYPYRFLKLGVPNPEAAPVLDVESALPLPGQVVLVNPGAELDLVDWIGDIDFRVTGDIPELDARSGAKFFWGGASGDSEAQTGSYFLDDLNASPGQSITLSWWQARGFGNGQATMGIRFFDATATQIGDTQFAVLNAPATAHQWTQRTLDGIVIPEGTFALRLVQQYVFVSGDNTDGYIDDITLQLETLSLSFDGSNLLGFQTAAVSVDDGVGQPPPSLYFNSVNAPDSQYVFRNIGSQRSPLVTMEVDCLKDENEFFGELGFLLFADAGGGGTGLALNREAGQNITIRTWSSWSLPTGVTNTVIDGGSRERFKDVWLRVSITAEKIGATTARLTVSVRGLLNGITYLEPTVAEVPVNGDFFGIRHSVVDGRNKAYVDNIRLTVATPVVADDTDQTFTQYVYTFVNILGQESAPSPASRVVAVDGNIARIVTTSTVPPVGYEDSFTGGPEPYPNGSKRIYRLVTGTNGTQYQFVVEIPLEQADYTDTLPDELLGAVLQTLGWAVPLPDLFGILSAPRFMVGFSKNQACFSIVDQPHAWDPLARRNTDFAIVGGAVIDNDIFVLTQERPYIAQGTDPLDMDLQKLSKPIGCVSRRSIVVMSPWGVVYASSDGLSYANRSDVDLLTRRMFTEQEWKALNPSSILGVVHDGRYFGFYDATSLGGVKGGFIIDPNESGFGLVELSIHATAAYSNPITDELYLVVDGVLVVWDAGVEKMAYEYLSREMLHPYPTSYEAAYVDVRNDGACSFELIYDDTSVQTVAPLRLEFLIRDTVCERAAQYRLIGTATVRRPPCVAQDMEELV